MIAGVCGALAQHFGLRLGTVRLLFALFGLVGAGEVVYLVLWLVIPSSRR